MRVFARASLLAGVAVAALASPAWAQDDAEAGADEAIIVLGQRLE